jgi:hypothetical protein
MSHDMRLYAAFICIEGSYLMDSDMIENEGMS